MPEEELWAALGKDVLDKLYEHSAFGHGTYLTPYQTKKLAAFLATLEARDLIKDGERDG